MAALACSEDEPPSEGIGGGGTGGSSSGTGGTGGGGPLGGSGGSAGSGRSAGSGGTVGVGGVNGTGIGNGGAVEFTAELEGDSVRLTTSANVWVERCSGRLRMMQRSGARYREPRARQRHRRGGHLSSRRQVPDRSHHDGRFRRVARLADAQSTNSMPTCRPTRPAKRITISPSRNADCVPRP